MRRFFLDFCADARGEGVKAAILVALGAVLEGVGLALLVPMLRAVTDPGWIASYLPAMSRLGTLSVLLALFAALISLRALVLWRRDVLLAELRAGFVERQRARLVGRLAAAPWTIVSRMRQARINHLLGSDIVLTGTCVHFMLQGGVSLCMLAMQWGLAFLLSPALAVFVGLLLAGAGLGLLPQLAKSRALGKESAEAHLHLTTSGAEFLGGLKLAMSQNLQYRFVEEFNATLSRLSGRQVAFVRAQSRAQLVSTTLASLAGAAAILLGTALLDIPPPQLIVFVLLLARMGGPAAQLQQGAQQFANFLPSYEKVKALEAELTAKAPAAAPSGPLPAGPLRFQGVSFRHAEGGRGVFDLDLVIEPGSFVGVTGASGAGKTTFADLLVGLLAPQVGTMSLDGREMSEGMRARWRSMVAYAPQEAFLFHDTIRANLLWADPAAGETELAAALRAAGAGNFVSSLDIVVGDKGGLLSGGERQRLTLARALLRKSPLLILDETTSAIDVAAERAVLEALAALPWRPAIVLIAHRAESLALCDRIIEFAEGRIVSDRCKEPAMSAR
jgi:ATP-binding cassette subfamily C protein